LSFSLETLIEIDGNPEYMVVQMSGPGLAEIDKMYVFFFLFLFFTYWQFSG
jgi:hypothetical protein